MKKSRTWKQWYKKHVCYASHVIHPVFMRKQKGFTLIELMVVMAIIAILATAGLSAYTSYLKGARDSKRITMARELRTIVEALTTISGPPIPADVNSYLEAEGLAWNIPAENPLLVRAAESLVGVVGVLGVPHALALLEDPVGGKPVCLDHERNPTIVCQFVYYKFSDGSYAISYGVEKEANLINAHYSDLSDPPGTYGSFIGINAAIPLTPTPETTNIEDESVNSGLTHEALALSTADGTNPGGGGTIPTGDSCSSTSECAESGDVCRYDPGSGGAGGKFCGNSLPDGTSPCDDNNQCATNYCNSSATCTTGDIGAVCSNNSHCPISGYCNTYSGVCSGGNAGDGCNDPADCSNNSCTNNVCD